MTLPEIIIYLTLLELQILTLSMYLWRLILSLLVAGNGDDEGGWMSSSLLGNANHDTQLHLP
jgi:hypothetical protein